MGTKLTYSSSDLKSLYQKAKRQCRSAFLVYENNDPESALMLVQRALESLDAVAETATRATDLPEAAQAKWARLKERLSAVHQSLADTQRRPYGEPDMESYLGHVDLQLMEVDRLCNQTRDVAKALWKDSEGSLIEKKKLIQIGGVLGGILAAVLLGMGVRMWLLKGNGLNAEYFSDLNFSNLYLRRVDKQIDFDWQKTAPAQGMPEDNFSIRWTGALNVKKAGQYSLFTLSDDSVRLTVDGKVLIENWTVHPLALDRADVYLEAGAHPIKVEFLEYGNDAVMKLLWKKPGDANRSPVPASVLTVQP